MDNTVCSLVHLFVVERLLGTLVPLRHLQYRSFIHRNPKPFGIL